MEKLEFQITNDFIVKIFDDLFNHAGWSEFYQKYVIVEPIWYFNIDNNLLTDLVCLDSILYKFEKPFGSVIADNIDEEASEFIEQAMIIKNNVILICDNPILFPYNRLKDFAAYLAHYPSNIHKIRGIIHYHIDEQELSNEDVIALKLFYKKIYMPKKVPNYLGIIISQKDPARSLQYSDKSKFVNKQLNEFMIGNISISGKLFDNNIIHNVEFILNG